MFIQTNPAGLIFLIQNSQMSRSRIYTRYITIILCETSLLVNCNFSISLFQDPKPFFRPPNEHFADRGRQFKERYTELTSANNLRDLKGHAIPAGSLQPGVASPQKISGSRVCEESKTSPWSVKQTGATRAGSERGPWGPFYHDMPDPVGSRTFSYGMEPAAQTDKAALARCNERNLTALSGPIIMKYGRPNTNYYVQRHPRKSFLTSQVVLCISFIIRCNANYYIFSQRTPRGPVALVS